MDLADIRRSAQAAREFVHLFEDAATGTRIQFTLRVPVDHEIDCAVGAQGLRSSTEALVRSTRAITELAIIGWQGAKVADVLPGHKHGAEPFEFEPAAKAVLLDERSDIAAALWLPLLERLEARRIAAAETAKNSPRASTGVRARPVRASSKKAA